MWASSKSTVWDDAMMQKKLEGNVKERWPFQWRAALCRYLGAAGKEAAVVTAFRQEPENEETSSKIPPAFTEAKVS
jgi:hypothetical protein